jgi:hypothetical protein
LDELRSFRNAIAHGVHLEPDDRARTYLLAKDLRDRIPSVLARPRHQDEGVSPPPQEQGAREIVPQASRGAGIQPILDTGRVRARWLEVFLRELQAKDSVQVVDAGLTQGLPTIALRVRGVTRLRIVVGQTAIAIEGTGDSRRRLRWLRTDSEARQAVDGELRWINES